jgi:hypothetical protein
MKNWIALPMIVLPTILLPPAIGSADEAAPASPTSAAAPSAPAPPTSDRSPIQRVAPEASVAGTDSVHVASEAKWEIAGYNNNEIVYTIYLTSQDPRILRCTTDIHGWYLENGEKQQISDRQITTVFPDQPAQVGNWMGLDRDSGATYSVKCRPI